MCAAGEMWSSETCEYNLHVRLENDEEGATVTLPDAGEPTKRQVISLSCSHDGPLCVDVVLDCLDGESCGAFVGEDGCRCGDEICPSEVTFCG